MNSYKLLLPIIALYALSGCQAKLTVDRPMLPRDEDPTAVVQDCVMDIWETDSLVIYTPTFSRIDLMCGTMPSPGDSTVILCCEAAFTGKEAFDGKQANPFEHRFIAGNHVSSGTLHKGYKCRANTGCFAYYPDSRSWEFAHYDYKDLLDKAEKSGGMAFGQTMIIYNGEDVHKGRPCKDTSKNEYRALCEISGKLCIIDGKGAMPYGDFVKALKNAGVRHALYLDMGTGWNYSFYRDNDGIAHFIHDIKISGTTNWITFYK